MLLGADWLLLKETVGAGKESSRWIMKANSKQLEFVDGLHERKQIIAGFPRTLQTNHIPPQPDLNPDRLEMRL